MPESSFQDIDTTNIQTPCFVIDEDRIKDNLTIIDRVQKEADCKMLLALKAYAVYTTFPLMKQTLQGVCAGSLHEARLGREEFRKEVHTYSPAFKEEEFQNILGFSDYVVFNSFSQFERFMPFIKRSEKRVKVGIRVNPEKSVAGKLFKTYDPCGKNSKLGITLNNLHGRSLEEITGLHFHALCEQGADELEIVLKEFDKKFEPFIKQMKWVNFGGGHHITREDYNVTKLIGLIKNFRKKYPNIIDVYLEPGEAVVLNAGVLVTSVLDIVHNKKDIAILDTSVETHFPDVLITRYDSKPYIPQILGAQAVKKGKLPKYRHDYILGGASCAAGDVFGEYSFPNPLNIKDKLIFTDAAYYTIVKTSTFCGVNIPSIALMSVDNPVKVVKQFGYIDYKNRLA